MRLSSTVVPLAGLAPANVMCNASVAPGCQALGDKLSDAVFYSGSPVYSYESQEFWSNTEKMSPGCIFRPQSSSQLAQGLGQLVDVNAQFAVRGGGHMGIRVPMDSGLFSA